MKHIIVPAIAAIALAGCVDNKPEPPPAAICTMDAKQCPDGSFVGRSGPNCEFVCPAPADGGMSMAPGG
jgi:hypothetical protein